VQRSTSLWRECRAECLGTFILVIFGVGAVHTAVLTMALQGLWQVAVVWGVAIALAIYATGAISGAHINPAITIAFAAYRRFPLRKVGPYILAQLIGAFLGAATLYLLFHNSIHQFELTKGIVRGMPGSELSAMVYGEYFPNPALFGTGAQAMALVSPALALGAEAFGTALLAFFVFAVTDTRNPGRPQGGLAALMIGLAVAIIISIIAPLTQAGLNPARDFGPRLFAWLAGWGSIAIPGARGGFFTVYILGPILGACAGGAVYQWLLHPAMPAATVDAPSTIPPILQGEHPMSTKPHLVLVGGFLGAGKTTLLGQAARRLAARGQRVGLITNDQAPELVDTKLLARAGTAVKEIAGGCFCCRFGDLIAVADQLMAEMDPEVIFSEPVGSCTDLSATVLQPLKEHYGDRFHIAPFSVLVDPRRLEEALEPRLRSPLHASARYILRKQLEEADLIVLNKTDLLAPEELDELRARVAERFPETELHCISALTGEGVEAWLAAVLAGRPAGQHILDIDYDTYAEGEAVLGWVNATASLTTSTTVDWDAFSRRLLQVVQRRIQARAGEIAHAKLLLATGRNHLAANLTRSQDLPAIQGALPADSRAVEITINVRAEMAPDILRAIIEESMQEAAETAITVHLAALNSLSPGRPQPVHRYTEVV